MGPRIHVVGNVVLDLIVRGKGSGPGAAADAWGDNVELLDAPVLPSLGGCGAAPAWVLGRLGDDVSLATNLGDDDLGRLAGAWLDDAGVHLTAPAAATTAVHVIHVDGARRRSSYWRGDKVRWLDDAPAARWWLVSGYGAVDGDDLEALQALLPGLRWRGVRVLFDPSPWFAGRVAPAAMRRLWGSVEALSGTEEELRHWLPDGGAQGGVELARACAALGPAVVAVKRGARGACWAAADSGGQVATDAVVEGNSVGAGDTFNARLIHGLSRGEAVARAVAAAVDLATRVVRGGRGVLGLEPDDLSGGSDR